MKKPDTKLEKQLNSIGVFVEPKNSLKGTSMRLLSVMVEVDFPATAELETPDFNIKVVSKREVETFFSEFEIKARGEKKVFSFTVSQPIPEDLVMPELKQVMATSFIDMCWYAGCEAVNEELKPDAATAMRPEAKYSDLGWALPSRFVDNAIMHAMGTLNNVFLAGALEDAMIYGYSVNRL